MNGGTEKNNAPCKQVRIIIIMENILLRLLLLILYSQMANGLKQTKKNIPNHTQKKQPKSWPPEICDRKRNSSIKPLAEKKVREPSRKLKKSNKNNKTVVHVC